MIIIKLEHVQLFDYFLTSVEVNIEGPSVYFYVHENSLDKGVCRPVSRSTIEDTKIDRNQTHVSKIKDRLQKSVHLSLE